MFRARLVLLSAMALAAWVAPAAMADEDPGATLDREVGCGITTGFFNNGSFVGFAGLFPDLGPQGFCPLSNFARVNPDGTVDRHIQGSGRLFLVLPGVAIYGSDGSDVRWRSIQHENGIRMFTVTGTLSDGSRVRAHFVTTPGGENTAANSLWIEGVGYAVGGPPGQE